MSGNEVSAINQSFLIVESSSRIYDLWNSFFGVDKVTLPMHRVTDHLMIPPEKFSQAAFILWDCSLFPENKSIFIRERGLEGLKEKTLWVVDTKEQRDELLLDSCPHVVRYTTQMSPWLGALKKMGIEWSLVASSTHS